MTDAAGVCNTTGLYGPPTAAQRFLATLATASADTPDTDIGMPSEVQTPKASDEPTRAQNEAAVVQMIDEAREEVLAQVRSKIQELMVKGGDSLEYSVNLPNGCKLNVAIETSIDKSGSSQPTMTFKASGSVEATFGAVSGKVELAYSKSSNDRETFSFEACAFGGVNAGFDNLVTLEAKAGVCAVFRDTSEKPAELEVDAVAVGGFSVNFGNSWYWGHGAEAREPLSREVLSFDLIR